MGAVSFVLTRAGGLLLVLLLMTAVLWETAHLFEWGLTICERTGDGSIAAYLRAHAYTYVTWAFGTDFGWTVG